MLPCSKLSIRSVLFAVCVVILSVFFTSAATAQDQEVPKMDIFVGYQWLHPGGTVPAPFGDINNPSPLKVPDMGKGLGAAFTYNLDQHWGLEGDVGHNGGDHDYETTLSVGPRFMARTDTTNYFLHALLGYNLVGVQDLNYKNGIGAILGGGMDLKFTHFLSWRLFEADYVWTRHNYSQYAAPEFGSLRRPTFEGVRLRTGIVMNFGYSASVPPAASCSVQPSEVNVGEPVTATATASNFNPKHTLSYTWSGNGGKVSGKDNTASIDTNGMAGGSYTVSAHITDPKMKKDGEASCTANFTVKELPKNPPTVSLSASPSSVTVGAPSTITATCSSPDNMQTSVAGWTASSGTITGNGNTATLDTTGAAPGSATVSATCSDSRGLSSAGSTSVNVQAPALPPPPPPQASKLSECDFSNMAKIGKPWRVDNECKAILDDVAKNLQQNADNKLVVVGNQETAEKRKNLAGERAVNSKAYLTGGESKQGIDPSRVETRTGNLGTKSAQFWIVPAGASFPTEGTDAVNEAKVKAVPDHPKVAAKKKAAAH
ncbi:MAG TPA: hypothetical protein VH079_03625 [Terriglobales bacterium]|nr:hypothetical protein [Terriglobales bacterium]